MDGTQGFLLLQDEQGALFTFYDNAFPPAFQRAWQEIKKLVEGQPASIWKINGKANGFDAYQRAKRAGTQ